QVMTSFIYLKPALFPALLRQTSLGKDADAGTRRRDLGVAVKGLDDPNRPRLDRLRLWVATLVQVKNHERVSVNVRIASLMGGKSQAVPVARLVRRPSFDKGRPGRRAGGAGQATRAGVERRLVPFGGLGLPHVTPDDPMRDRLESSGDVVRQHGQRPGPGGPA